MLLLLVRAFLIVTFFCTSPISKCFPPPKKKQTNHNNNSHQPLLWPHHSKAEHVHGGAQLPASHVLLGQVRQRPPDRGRAAHRGRLSRRAAGGKPSQAEVGQLGRHVAVQQDVGAAETRGGRLN